MKNGSIDTTVKTEDEDSYLYLSVPVDDGWDVLMNNEKAEINHLETAYIQLNFILVLIKLL